MATVLGSYVETPDDTVVITWTPLTEFDTGAGVGAPRWPDKTVQLGGTFGAGTVALEGSNDGTNWSALHDYQGNAISISDTTLHLIAENPAQIRPRSTAGSGMSVTITVTGAR